MSLTGKLTGIATQHSEPLNTLPREVLREVDVVAAAVEVEELGEVEPLRERCKSGKH